MIWAVFIKNRISPKYRYIEITPTIKFFQNVADTIWISEIYLRLLENVKPFNRKGGKL
jgi:hypothetical protein